MKYLLCLLITCLHIFQMSAKDVTSVLQKLDREMLQREKYFVRKDSVINDLKRQLNLSVTLADSFRISNRIYDQYKSYQYDSAYVYANSTHQLAQRMNDSDALLRAEGKRLFCLLSGGAFYEADAVAKETELKGTSHRARGDFYALCTRLYSDLYYFTKTPAYRETYLVKMKAYRDSVLALLPDTSVVYRLTDALYVSRNSSDKQQKLLRLVADEATDLHQKAIILANAANLYLGKNDTLSSGGIFSVRPQSRDNGEHVKNRAGSLSVCHGLWRIGKPLCALGTG